MSRILLCAYVATLAGCTKHNEKFCSSDGDCTADSARTFCDVNGDYDASDHTANTCIPPPPDCPLERCGCMPGAALTCDLDQLTVCNADGKTTTTSTCAMGCSTDARCLTFDPSNGLGPAFTDAASQPDVTIPAGSTINTNSGMIQDSSNQPVAVKSTSVAQVDGSSIRVFEAKSFSIDAVTITGAASVAFVASGAITIEGLVDASAKSSSSGPGGQDVPAVCVGNHGFQYAGSSCFDGVGPCAEGPGGGGNATPGGAGGAISNTAGAHGIVGGVVIPTFEPLVGGCHGGFLRDAATNTTIRPGGGGGGAIQLVSGDQVQLLNAGVINLAGGGGPSNTGGGSGGNLVIEAPTVRVVGSGAGIAANGGAGGGCGMTGADGPVSGAAAAALSCGVDSSGSGGTATVSPGDGAMKICTPASQTCNVEVDSEHGGGGGSVGRARITTKTGDFTVQGAPLMSITVTEAQLIAK